MSLISKWRRPVILPAMPERRLAAGKNTVTQTVFPGATVSALFFDSQYTGHDLIRLDPSPPFNEMLIRLPRAHRVDSPLPVLTALDPDQYKNATTPLERKWDRLGALTTSDWRRHLQIPAKGIGELHLPWGPTLRFKDTWRSNHHADALRT